MTMLITGATGLIGCRLAEVATARGREVVGLVRTWSGAARLARLPVRMVHGDILNLDSLRAAARGCDAIVHCAVDNRVGGAPHRQSSARGTENVVRVAQELGVRRVVHLSSVAVYGYRPGPDAATEDGPLTPTGDAYCDGKIEAERVARRFHAQHGTPVVIIRPTIVYGPFGSWTTGIVGAIRAGQPLLIDGGAGICNSCYVDNLVDALLLALDSDRVVGEIFHISDAEATTWRTFVEGHAGALVPSPLPLPELTIAEYLRLRAQLPAANLSSLAQVVRLLRDRRTHEVLMSIPAFARGARLGVRAAQRVLPARIRKGLRDRVLGSRAHGAGAGDALPVPPLPSPDEVDIFTTRVAFSIAKAQRLLGYAPRVSFDEGIARTAAWIRWARL